MGKAAPLPAEERASFADTLAWACFANGRDAEATANSDAALALAATEKKTEYRDYLATLNAKIAAAAGEAGAAALADLRASVAKLEVEMAARRTFTFADESQRFLHDMLADLLRKLTSLDGNERKEVDARLRWAQQVAALTRTLGHKTWREAGEAIAKADGILASELYRGQRIELREQDVTGLVPTGMNPVTRLWEFYDLRSAWDGASDPAAIEVPRHIETGERAGDIDMGDGTGIVFVLLPGGRFTMGSQDNHPTAPHYDPQRNNTEAMHTVELAPFFLARHELTKGQWKRLSWRADPGWHQVGEEYQGNPAAITECHPVESVDWVICQELLRRHAMALPTETQWEYGCRAGTTTPWWTGGEATSLAMAANLLDLLAEREYPEWGRQEGDFGDGWCCHAPVASFRPNPFGLFDVHGNVWEWTRDGQHGPGAVPRAGDGLRGDPDSASLRVIRGGSFHDAARSARSGFRSGYAPTFRNAILGVRAARTARQGDVATALSR